MTVNVAIAQINCTVGDIVGNRVKIASVARRAAAQGAHIVLTPELSLVGYPPEDLLLRPSFCVKAADELAALANELADLQDLHVVVGHPLQEGDMRFNAVSVLLNGIVAGTYCKRELPNAGVFDEKRYFDAADQPLFFDIKDVRFGLNLCEDTWLPHAPDAAAKAGVQVLLVPNASPYELGKQHRRIAVMRENVCTKGMSVVYANLVGGQDELVFDGNSFVLDQEGAVRAHLQHCVEDMQVVTFRGAQPVEATLIEELPQEAQIYQALVLGVRDYVGKNGFPGVLLGLSGGVDSALVLAIALDALGADKVRAIMMPSPYTAGMSMADSRDMVGRIGVRYDEIPIEDCFNAFQRTLTDEFTGLPPDVTEENIQARIRGTLIMALSNKYGTLVLTTGNKSEMAVGYCTLYGDMAGGFAVLKDVSKTWVYRLCHWRNTVSDIIPARILTRAPSAELRHDQTDQDSLPEYDVLDGIMRLYVEENRSRADMVAAGYNEEAVERVAHLIKLNEYKRRQAPVGIRITHRAFGRDWRYPITSQYRD